ARQQALGRVILKDPAVAGLSSFIGVAGTNVTLNSGRLLITLKPLSERVGVTDVIERLRTALTEVAGITLYLQPVQDLTVEDRVSRTQFQYGLEDADEKELRTWAPRLLARLREQPQRGRRAELHRGRLGAGAAGHRGQRAGARGPARHRPPGTVPRRDDLVQPGARRLPGRRRRRHQRRRARDQPAAVDPDGLPRR